MRSVTFIGPPYLFGASRRRPASQVLQTVPEHFGDYHEPYLGGGARAIAVMQSHPDAIYQLHSASAELGAVWRALPAAIDDIVARVLEHVALHSRSHFDEVRRQALSGDAGSGEAGSGDAGSGDVGSGDAGSGDVGSGDVGSGDADRAARFIYLCGSAQGGGAAGAADDFATAQFGRDTVAFDESNLRALAALLADRDVRVDARPLFDQIAVIREVDFVFLDAPTTERPPLTAVRAAGLRELKSFVSTVTARGAFVLLAGHPSDDEVGGAATWNGVVRLDELAHRDGRGHGDGGGEVFWANSLLVRALNAKR
ncbi:MAG: hypothetical protein JWQ64_2721 [Subtercola sp.]|nr:hypothetical protein [Subtercola sp.]